MRIPSIPWGTHLRLGNFATFDEAMDAFDDAIDEWHDLPPEPFGREATPAWYYLGIGESEYKRLVEKPAEFVAPYLRAK